MCLLTYMYYIYVEFTCEFTCEQKLFGGINFIAYGAANLNVGTTWGVH